jgi:NAD(P)H-flavin reductase
MSYPQGWYTTSSKLTWLTPPSLGKCLFIVFYWITITVLLTANAISSKSDPYYFERIGFRGAWVSLMQVPLVVLLAARTNIIGFLIGSSYERLNWAHRWIARTMLVTVAVHAGFFLREWIRADFLQEELSFMPIVKYGMGAGGTLLWMNLSGLPFFRHIFYEFFVIQHLASIALFLWLLHMHVPSYAMHFVLLAIGFVAFDRIARLVWLAFRNIRFLRGKGKNLRLIDRIGYEAELYPSPGGITRVIVNNIPFRWSAGQHVYIWIPRMGFPESHPFTISTACPPKSKDSPVNTDTSIELHIRAHSGFSRRLLHLAEKKSTLDKPLTVRCILQGPYGSFPQWNTYDTLLLIAASTGASFTLPIFESVLNTPGCVRRLHFLLLVRKRPQCSCYLARLRVLARVHKQLDVSIHVAVTRGRDGLNDDEAPDWDGPVEDRCCCGPVECCCGAPSEKADSQRRGSSESQNQQQQQNAVSSGEPLAVAQEAVVSEKAASGAALTPISSSKSSLQGASSSSKRPVLLSVTRAATSKPTDVAFVSRRPMLDAALREAVENAQGETGVVVCGGKALSGHVRNAVAQLSDERAVHKGTGAQGIALHVEEFGF